MHVYQFMNITKNNIPKIVPFDPDQITDHFKPDDVSFFIPFQILNIKIFIWIVYASRLAGESHTTDVIKNLASIQKFMQTFVHEGLRYLESFIRFPHL